MRALVGGSRENSPKQDGPWHIRNIKTRLHEEWLVFWHNYEGVKIVCCMGFCVYFGIGVQRNVANYWHKPGPVLDDLGFSLIPEIKSDAFKHGVEIVYFTGNLSFTFLVLLGNLVFQAPGQKRIYVIHILYKAIIVWGSLQLIRGFCFLSTQLPGPGPHCHAGGAYEEHKQKSLGECFTKLNAGYPNCGDLIFSGHMMTLITNFYYFQKYSKTLFCYYPRLYNWIFTLIWLFAPIQAYMIIALRNHYTVDVIVACLLTPLYIYWFENTWPNLDADPLEKRSVAEEADSVELANLNSAARAQRSSHQPLLESTSLDDVESGILSDSRGEASTSANRRTGSGSRSSVSQSAMSPTGTKREPHPLPNDKETKYVRASVSECAPLLGGVS